jgi:hypothetical protein
MEGCVERVIEERVFPSGFRKREFVIKTADAQYPQDIKFDVVNDKIALLDGIETGDQVSVTFNLRGNEYNGKYYVNLVAWKLEKVTGGEHQSEDSEEPSAMPWAEEDDDTPLPF